MKRYLTMTVATILVSFGSYSWSAEGNPQFMGSLYNIVPTTVGDNSIVNAIKGYSNITQADVNRWKPLNAWFVGASIRAGVVEKIKNYIKVCMSLKLAHHAFDDEASLRDAFPIHWSTRALCAALKNLKDQGLYALALLAQIGIDSEDVKGWADVISSHITTIEHNRDLLKISCTLLAKKKETKETEAIKLALDRIKLEEMKAKAVTAQLNIIKTVGGYALKNVAELIKEGVENAAPTALLGIAVYFAQKMGAFAVSSEDLKPNTGSGK
jgi:hypothetical protein